MSDDSSRNTPMVRKTHPVWWVIAICLAVIAINLTLRDEPWMTPSWAQNVQSAGARGIFAFTGQLTPTTYGVFMVDVDAGNIWCYEYLTVGGIKKLRLVSARSFIFDRYLEDYNLDGPTPQDVKAMVEQQRAKGESDTGTKP